jgi:ATP-dependent DNA ligase
MGLVKTIAELEQECQVRGLTVSGTGRNGKVQKMDLIHALERYSLQQLEQAGQLLPGCKALHAAIESPMLAQSQAAFKSEQAFQEMVGSSDYVAEVKEDGARILICYNPGVGFEIFSRNRSVENYLFGNYTNQIYGWDLKTTEGLLPFSFILDGELVSLNPSVNGHVVTDTVLAAVVAILGMNQRESYRMQAEAGYPLRYQVFDVLQYDGQLVMDKPLADRKAILHELVRKIYEASDRLSLPQLKWIQEVGVVSGGWAEKKALFDRVVDARGEGLVLKDLKSPYHPYEARGGMGGGFLKWKRTVSQSVGGDIDAFVTGYSLGNKGTALENLVASLEFSVILVPSGEKHVIANISGLTDEDHRTATVTGTDGSPTLNPAWYNRVGAITGQDVSSRSRSFSHARLIRWRQGADTKNWWDCKFYEDVLNNLVL